MSRVQVYVSDEVAEKINAIVEKRRAEGARDKDVSNSSISSMLLELGLRVYEAQMERKGSAFNQTEYNKVLLENVLKTQMSVVQILSICSLSPHIENDSRFKYGKIVEDIKKKVSDELEIFFSSSDDE